MALIQQLPGNIERRGKQSTARLDEDRRGRELVGAGPAEAQQSAQEAEQPSAPPAAAPVS